MNLLARILAVVFVFAVPLFLVTGSVAWEVHGFPPAVNLYVSTLPAC